MVGRTLQETLSGLREALLSGGQRALGHPSQLGDTILRATILLSAMGAVAGVWALFVANLPAHRNSYGVAAPVIRFATSTWSYVILELILLRSVLYVSNAKKAQQAGSYLGMSADGVRRLAAEAKSTTGTSRVIATSEDTVREIRERLEQALQEPEPEPDVLRWESVGESALQAQLSRLQERRGELLDEQESLSEEIEANLEAALDGEISLGELQESGERTSPYELLSGEEQAAVDDAEALLERMDTLQAELQDIQHDIALLRRWDLTAVEELQEAAESARSLAGELEAAGFDAGEEPDGVEVSVEYPSLLGYLRPAAVLGGSAAALGGLWSLLPGLLLALRPYIPQAVKAALPFESRAALLAFLEGMSSTTGVVIALTGVALAVLGSLIAYLRARREAQRRARRIAEHGDPDVPVDTPESERGLQWGEALKLWRMDTAAALETKELIWQFAVPALVTWGLLVIAAGIWLQAWVYPLLLCAGILLGAVNYARISRSREQTLQKLRDSTDFEAWDSASVLVKGPVTVETTEMCYAWFNGRGYAHSDPETLAAELAPRVHQLLHGEEISPSVLQKYHRNLRDMFPDLEGWRRNVEEHQIARELIHQLESAPDGIMPKAQLIEQTVEADREAKLWGLMDTGIGYDPALVRQMYLELSTCSEADGTAHMIVEEEMEVEAAHGEMETVTSCRLRSDPLPPDVSELRAQFSTRYRAYAQYEPLYRLPDIQDPEPEPLHQDPPEPSEDMHRLSYTKQHQEPATAD